MCLVLNESFTLCLLMQKFYVVCYIELKNSVMIGTFMLRCAASLIHGMKLEEKKTQQREATS